MSGAEALAVVGIIANILQLVDFSSKAISRVKEYGQDAQDVPKTFRDIQTGLPLIVHTLGEIQTRVSDGQLPEKSCKALKGVLGDCEVKLTELKIIFERVLPQDGASRGERVWKAVMSLWQDKKVEGISQALWRSLQSLTLFHVVAAPRVRDIQALVENTSKMTLTSSPASAVPKYFTVPTLSSKNFVGRKEMMADLASRLCLPETHCRVAVVGLGGVGKTRVALQFAHEYRRSANISVFWVYAYNAERLRKAFDDIAKQVKIPGHQDPGTDTLRLVKEWFESDASGQWLLIIDNVDDTELLYPSIAQSTRYADYLPMSETGSILLTTRNGKVGHEFAATHNVLTLSGMDSEESMALLLTRLGDSQSEEPLEELAEELGRVPLALVQAASFITQNNVTVGKYLQLYRQNDSSRIQLLSSNFEDEGRHALSKNSIATTWSVSFEYIRKHHTQAADLLSFIGMLADEGVPEFLLPHGTEPVKFEKAIGTLHAFSFISTRYVELDNSQHRCFNFHRLVRLAMRNWLTINGRFDNWLAHAIEELVVVVDRGDLERYDRSSQCLPHAIELLADERLQGVPGPENVPAIFFKHKRKKRHSLLHRKPQEECMHEGSICPRCTQRMLHFVGETLYIARDWTPARAYLQRRLAICIHLFGDSHIETLRSLSNVVETNKQLSELETAERLCRKLIANSKPKSVPASRHTFEGMDCLVDILKDRGNHAEADAVQSQLMEICHRDIDQTYSDTNLIRLKTIAWILFSRDEFDEAAKYQLRVVEGYRTAMSVQNYNTILALKILALIYFYLSRYDEAENYTRLAFDSFKVLSGPGDPYTIQYMLYLSRYLRWQSKITEADDLAESALRISAETFGDTSTTYLGLLKWHQNYLRGYELNDKDFWDERLITARA